MIHELIREGWLPPEQSAEVITILNDLVHISKNSREENMFRDQIQLNKYRALANKEVRAVEHVITGETFDKYEGPQKGRDY